MPMYVINTLSKEVTGPLESEEDVASSLEDEEVDEYCFILRVDDGGVATLKDADDWLDEQE